MVERGIAVCGLGKLGAPIAAAFAASDVPVMGYDVDEAKVRAINERRAPVQEPELAEYLQLSVVQNNLRATIRADHAVETSDACLFVTPTPSLRDGSFCHDYLLEAIGSIAREVHRQNRHRYLFITNSTVQPQTHDEKILPLLRRLAPNTMIHVAYKPEFIAIGTVLQDLHYPDLVLVGADSEDTTAAVVALYRKMVMRMDERPIHCMELLDAELAKISINCAVTMRISFANQVGMVARKLGADPSKILNAVGSDSGIALRALRFGSSFGGPYCPRDNRMFQRVAESVGECAPLCQATDIVNRRLLRSILESVPPHGTIGILGLAYKPGAVLSDESAGLWLKQALQSRGRAVRTHDPLLTHSHTLEEVLQCPTVIVACAALEYSAVAVPADCCLIDFQNVVQRQAVLNKECT